MRRDVSAARREIDRVYAAYPLLNDDDFVADTGTIAG
jgi:hypothetical protein